MLLHQNLDAPGCDLVFKREGCSLSIRATVGDFTTPVYERAGQRVGEASGVRNDPEIIVEVIKGVLFGAE